MTVMTKKKVSAYEYADWVRYIKTIPKQFRWNRWVCIDYMISMNGFVDADDIENIQTLYRDGFVD